MSERATHDGWVREPASGVAAGAVSRGITIGRKAAGVVPQSRSYFAAAAIGSPIADQPVRCGPGD